MSAAEVWALRAFADELRDRYTEDVFPAMSDLDHRSVNDALAGRRAGTPITRDRVSADMMRRAAAQADQRADEIETADLESHDSGATSSLSPLGVALERAQNGAADYRPEEQQAQDGAGNAEHDVEHQRGRGVEVVHGVDSGIREIPEATP